MVVADVHAEVGGAGLEPALEETEIEIGKRREAAMGIPDDRLAMQGGGMRIHGFDVLLMAAAPALPTSACSSLAAISASSHSRNAFTFGRSAAASGATT